MSARCPRKNLEGGRKSRYVGKRTLIRLRGGNGSFDELVCVYGSHIHGRKCEVRVTYQSNFRVDLIASFAFPSDCLVLFFSSNSSKFLFSRVLLRLPVSKLKCFCLSRGAISTGCRTRVVGACHLAGDRAGGWSDETILHRSLSHALFLWSIFMAETWESDCLCPL